MILVTGSTGFVGRRVVAVLTSGGHPVRALVHIPSRASVLSGYDVEIAQADVLDPDSLRRACEGVDALIHLVAVIRERGGQTFQGVNYQGTRKMLEAAEGAGVDRFIYSSALGASSDPAFPYLYSHWMAEQEVARSPISHTIVRFSVGFGEGDRFFNTLAAQAKLSPVVPVAGDGACRFQPIAVEDMARCLVAACERGYSAGRTIEAGGPEHLSYDEILDIVAGTLGVKIAKAHLPLALVKPAAALMELLLPRAIATGEDLEMLTMDNVTELDATEKAFGFQPRAVRGNLRYLTRIGLRDALKINLGLMPGHIRDH